MKAFSQAIVLLLAAAAAHAAEKAEPSKAAPVATEQTAEPMRTDRLDPAVIEREAVRRRAAKVPAFPAERR